MSRPCVISNSSVEFWASDSASILHGPGWSEAGDNARVVKQRRAYLMILELQKQVPTNRSASLAAEIRPEYRGRADIMIVTVPLPLWQIRLCAALSHLVRGRVRAQLPGRGPICRLRGLWVHSPRDPLDRASCGSSMSTASSRPCVCSVGECVCERSLQNCADCPPRSSPRNTRESFRRLGRSFSGCSRLAPLRLTLGTARVSSCWECMVGCKWRKGDSLAG